MPTWAYYRRVMAAYLTPVRSQLSFWHDTPQAGHFDAGTLGEYYMPFREKADYAGPFDEAGIPLLEYRGKLGRQYNPIAIAQYGLGNFNLWYERQHDSVRRSTFLGAATWLVTNLEQNSRGLWVWHHNFDFEYRTTLRAPWYSGLAQGQGISLLLRAHSATGESGYLEAAQRAFATMLVGVDQGGVSCTDDGFTWIEEYIVTPPTHILNGFIWASWGAYDYWIATGDPDAKQLFERAVATLAHSLPQYDTGYWSLYEQNGLRMPMLASPFYHRLHIAQLRVLYALTSIEIFDRYCRRWQEYQRNRLMRARAFLHKCIYKLCYY